MADLIQQYQDRQFSTTEAAGILDVHPEELRNQLKNGWHTFGSAECEPGRWRRVSIDDLLKFRIALSLSEQCVPMLSATEISQVMIPKFFAKEYLLAITVDRDRTVRSKTLAGEKDFSSFLSQFLAAAHTPDHSVGLVIVNLKEERTWLRSRIEKFYTDQFVS